MHFFRIGLIRRMAFAVALMCMVVSVSAMADTASAEEGFFALMEQNVFQDVLQAEGKVHILGCERATYILADDGKTLLRVEYYDADGQLAYYSEVLDFNADEKSYTENIYVYQLDTDEQTLLRTDTYENGQLMDSVIHEELPAATAAPTAKPTAKPTSAPTAAPTAAPTQTPTAAPTAAPTQTPTATPTAAPTQAPTAAPTAAPTQAPTAAPTAKADLSYDHTTSIYDNDEKTLLRVEYYNSDNKLTHYSQVENFDSNTNSYKENIYTYDTETNTQILQRTDVYVNGELESSENP